MLKPELYTFEIDARLLTELKGLVLDSLAREASRIGVTKLSISKAKQLLAAAQPCLNTLVNLDGATFRSTTLLDHKKISHMLHEALAESAMFFRTEGAMEFRNVQAQQDIDVRAATLWKALFDRRLVRWLRERGYLADPEIVEPVDIVVESVKLWVRDIATRLNAEKEAITPGAFFLDTETDLSAKVDVNGTTLTLKGRPDALIIDPTSQTPEVVEYKLGLQGQVELQIAQTVLYAVIVDAAKGTRIDRARLQFFRLAGDTPPDAPELQSSTVLSQETSESQTAYPAEVEAAFAGYVGNAAAVRLLKIDCAYAGKQTPIHMSTNIMLCGPGGLGKTELARRTARALKLPIVDIPASTVKSTDALLQQITETLKTSGQEPEDVGSDSGLPKRRYPPLVVFLDEIHLLPQADKYLNLFEPKDRRAVGSKEVADLSMVTFIGATTDKGILPPPFRSRFNIIDLQPYSAEEVADILAVSWPEVDRSFLVALANVSRRNPRVALNNAGIVKKMNVVHPDHYPLTTDALKRIAREEWNVDERGLNDADRAYLRALTPGPRGIGSLCQLVPVGKEEIQSVIEPFLLELGFINLTGRGRELTELGRKSLGS